jgi:predicted MPP superfamily phosphohydrolase
MKKAKKSRHRGRLIFLLIVFVLLFLFFDSNTRIVTEDFELVFDNLPAAFDGYRIVQLSDIHTAVYGEEK